jgi:transposase
LFRLSWNWRERSPVKITERTREESTGRHLVDKEPISSLCDELALQPTVFCRWQKEFFDNGAAAFPTKARPNHQAGQERIDYLEKKIEAKDEALPELMAEHVALEKALGKSDRGLGCRTTCGIRSLISC